MKQPNYKIYPSLLDKFQMFLDSEIEAEEFWNIDAEGNYKQSAEEIADRHERELIDSINRVETEPIEAADKGTCFNEIVDCLIEKRGSSREDLKIKSYKAGDMIEKPLSPFIRVSEITGITDESDCMRATVPFIRATLHGFQFDFDLQLCKDAAEYFRGALPQHSCVGQIDTRYGTVELYGYIDEIVKDKVKDIKTTSSYNFGKFERKWQKEVYPYTLIQSGEMDNVSEFEYTVFVLSTDKRTGLITGKRYEEQYTYNHAETTAKLRLFCERFIEWLEAHRNLITDKKIFGGENDVQ